jgi:hypothetical protein
MTWNDQFLTLFDHCLTTFNAGDKDFENYYRPADRAFLASIGCKTREFFDFVEDFSGENEPSISTALLVAAVRRDYFLTVQKDIPSSQVMTRDDIPGFGEELAGMAYLPRILAKGRGKLRGELDPDIMFGCGGDRNFLKKCGDIHLADFLRHLWAAGDDDQKITRWIQSQKN